MTILGAVLKTAILVVILMVTATYTMVAGHRGKDSACLRLADRRLDRRAPHGRSAAEAESDGTLACRKFVVHRCLRGAAAGGCPRRSL
jgi:hypothetical protein